MKCGIMEEEEMHIQEQKKCERNHNNLGHNNTITAFKIIHTYATLEKEIQKQFKICK